MPEIQTSPMIRMAEIVLADELESALPLEQTQINVQISGPVASVAVTQRFGNSLKEPAELDYLFPLPEDAAITGFELQIGARHIHGELQEHGAAQARYEDARGQGKRAGLFEQRRPNLFALRLANVQAGETIQASLRYQQRLKFEDDTYTFVFPMGLTPKYNSPKHPGEGEGTHAPVAHPDEAIGPVEIQISVDAGLPMADPTSPSHALDVTRIDERRFQVRLAGKTIPDHDFVLRLPVSGDVPQAAGWTSGEVGQGYFMASLVPPRTALESTAASQAREFIFVLDRSGSMSGQPILQARNALRACLRALDPADTFRILLFDNQLEWLQSEPSQVTQTEIDRADAYLDKVTGRGGTEIMGALDAAMNLPADPVRTRFIVFLTDGAVSAEMRVLDGIRARLGAARLFTFGIGPSVNRALLNRMANLGRGRSAFLQLNEDIEGAIIQFQDSISFPALTDLALEWENGKTWDIYPARLPDLYFDQPLEICGRAAFQQANPLRLTLRGKHAGQPVTLQLDLPVPTTQDPVIQRLWAKARVEDLQDQAALEPSRAEKLRAEILGLALEHNLVTERTAFVAVDQETTSGGKPSIIHVAQPLPEGLQPGGFGLGGPVVGMAMAAAFMPSMPAPSGAPPAASRSLSEGDTGFFASMKQRLFKNPSVEQQASTGMVSGRAEVLPRGEAGLRWLARTQMINGSWNEDVEQTAAALLAFVRAGQTTRSGSYRQALRRAVRWLGDHPGDGFARFARARALDELAQATQDTADQQASQAARQGLTPASDLEAAALGQTAVSPAEIKTLADLRLAAMLRAPLAVPDDVLSQDQAGLAQVWALTL